MLLLLFSLAAWGWLKQSEIHHASSSVSCPVCQSYPGCEGETKRVHFWVPFFVSLPTSGDLYPIYPKHTWTKYVALTLLGVQSRFGDKVTWNLSELSSKRDCSSKLQRLPTIANYPTILCVWGVLVCRSDCFGWAHAFSPATIRCPHSLRTEGGLLRLVARSKVLVPMALPKVLAALSLAGRMTAAVIGHASIKGSFRRLLLSRIARVKDAVRHPRVVNERRLPKP